MQFYPRRHNRHALISVILLFLLSVLGIAVSQYLPVYPGFWQLAALGCAVAAILITNKFLLTSYLYVLTSPYDLDRFNYFTVVQSLGQKRKTVAKLDLNRAIALVPSDQADQVMKKQGLRPTERASFCVDLFAADAWTLITENGDEVLAVTVQDADGLIGEMKKRMKNE